MTWSSRNLTRQCGAFSRSWVFVNDRICQWHLLQVDLQQKLSKESFVSFSFEPHTLNIERTRNARFNSYTSRPRGALSLWANNYVTLRLTSRLQYEIELAASNPMTSHEKSRGVAAVYFIARDSLLYFTGAAKMIHSVYNRQTNEALY
jgi:hypothetical protein